MRVDRDIQALSLHLCLAAALAGSALQSAAAEPPASQVILEAVERGDCDAAVEAARRGVEAGEARAAFLAGRMLEEGVCVKVDVAGATPLYARAALLGDHDAGLDYAAKLGLGEGVEQSYERAGEICRGAGIDPGGQVSAYELGYACTVRAIAAKLARDALPSHAFRAGGGGLTVVEFRPASANLRVRTAPSFANDSEPATGSNLRRSRVDVRHAVESGWQGALASVPKPDPARLDDQNVELPIELQMVLDTRSKMTQHDATEAFIRALDRVGVFSKGGG